MKHQHPLKAGVTTFAYRQVHEKSFVYCIDSQRHLESLESVCAYVCENIFFSILCVCVDKVTCESVSLRTRTKGSSISV